MPIKLFFFFIGMDESVMTLGGGCHGSRRSPSWLCEQSDMPLGEIRHLWRLASASKGNILLWLSSLRALVESLQSHDRYWWRPTRETCRSCMLCMCRITFVSYIALTLNGNLVRQTQKLFNWAYLQNLFVFLWKNFL